MTSFEIFKQKYEKWLCQKADLLEDLCYERDIKLWVVQGTYKMIYIIFIICSLVNVIVSTLKSIITVKGSKLSASVINAISYAINTVVIVYTAGDFALWIKILISASTNFIGVYIGIWILDKLKKDKLWEIKGIIDREPTEEDYKCLNILTTNKILFTMQKTLMSKTFIYIYSSNKDESRLIKDVLNKMGAKHIVNEETVKL